mmetsp:Transcript_45097/g.116635  ORF Transcript_45097/g.116635 Transcript_45097/m.116635 type:complete len:257 (-) Transcript_45097:235-1005(-)
MPEHCSLCGKKPGVLRKAKPCNLCKRSHCKNCLVQGVKKGEKECKTCSSLQKVRRGEHKNVTIKELRQLMERMGIEATSAIEKEDLVEAVKKGDSSGRSRLDALRAQGQASGSASSSEREKGYLPSTSEGGSSGQGNARPPPAQPRPPKLSELSTYTVRQLRGILKEHNVSCEGVVEKQELVEMAFRVRMREYRFMYGEKEEEGDKDICKVCFDREIDTVLVPCGHIVVCGECASNVSRCPLCRNVIEQKVKVYRS